MHEFWPNGAVATVATGGTITVRISSGPADAEIERRVRRLVELAPMQELQLLLVAEERAAGAERYRVRGGRDTLGCVSPPPQWRFTASDIEGIFSWRPPGGSPTICFEVVDEREEDFYALTEAFAGRELALVCDSQIVGTMNLSEPAWEGRMATPLDATEVERVVDSFRYWRGLGVALELVSFRGS